MTLIGKARRACDLGQGPARARDLSGRAFDAQAPDVLADRASKGAPKDCGEVNRMHADQRGDFVVSQRFSETGMDKIARFLEPARTILLPRSALRGREFREDFERQACDRQR